MTPIMERLSERAVPFEVIEHDRTYTGIDEARAIGIDADEVLKVIAIDSIEGLGIAVIPASKRLDMHLVRAAVDDDRAVLATEGEIKWRWPAYQPGTLPPLGSLLGVPMYVDPELFGHDTVVFAAGDQTRSVKMRTKDLFRHETFLVAPLAISGEEVGVEGSARVPAGV